jgi:hypothetical protein
MAYGKGKSSPGKFMDSPVGMCSYKDNPMKAAARVTPECGPGMNADQRKANKLLKQAQSQKDSLRGKSGM